MSPLELVVSTLVRVLFNFSQTDANKDNYYSYNVVQNCDTCCELVQLFMKINM